MMIDAPPPPPIHSEMNVTSVGTFLEATIEAPDGPRRYKVYVPASYQKGTRVPLVVVLHGCTQDPDDIARGTRFNSLADAEGMIVAYPEQPQKANGLKCWNWFDASHQKRDAGEPALIASMTRRIESDYSIDPKRVYIAGVSAGGAMALITAYAYPEMFAAAGIHSGIAYGAAGSIADALKVMHGGASDPALLPGAVVRSFGSARSFPAIVFQGAADKSVNVVNSSQVVSQLLELYKPAEMKRLSEAKSVGAGGYHSTRRLYGSRKPLIEEWIVDELGHAWAGGSKDGTYTDPNGPDASREILRFFLEHPRS